VRIQKIEYHRLQRLVVLVASSSEYYSLAVLSRGRRALTTDHQTMRSCLLSNPGKKLDPAEVAAALRAELIASGRSPA